eukprot:5791832-Amphidinium_carterae.2
MKEALCGQGVLQLEELVDVREVGIARWNGDDGVLGAVVCCVAMKTSSSVGWAVHRWAVERTIHERSTSGIPGSGL